MKLISHRRNTITELESTEKCYGVEIDIRTYNDKLIIHHEPFIEGEDLENWLSFYDHNFLILNVKEEGLEERILHMMKQFSIEDFFFLDQSFPFLIKYANLDESRCAVRFSEFESIDTVLNLKNKVDWVWVDCFTHFPLTKDIFLSLRDSNFKICIVSPELQGRNDSSEIANIYNFMQKNDIIADAICSKNIDVWERLMDSK